MIKSDLEDIKSPIKELTKEEKREIKNEVKEIIKSQEKNIEENSIKQELTKEEKVSNFFNKIEFLSMDNDTKELVALRVKNDSVGDKLYWIEIFLSSLIAALGLIQNSVAVVIGAMLIAPLLRPINGLSFAIARGAQKFFLISIRVLFYSILASILMGALVSFVIGVNIQTDEILARSSPNIIDFFIAIFSAMVAVMSLRFKRLGESIAGVAMAASLMPPLAVVGIALAGMDFSLALGAMMLFLANLVAIIIVGTIFFWLYGFTPHMEKQQKSTFKRLIFMILSITIIIIPLLSSFLYVREEIKITQNIELYLNNEISKEINYFEISNIDIIDINKENIELKTTLKIDEGVDIIPVINGLEKSISDKIGKNVIIDLEVIRIIRISSIK